MSLEFIIIYIVIPALLGGIFAPKLAEVCRNLYGRWRDRNR